VLPGLFDAICCNPLFCSHETAEDMGFVSKNMGDAGIGSTHTHAQHTHAKHTHAQHNKCDPNKCDPITTATPTKIPNARGEDLYNGLQRGS